MPACHEQANRGNLTGTVSSERLHHAQASLTWDKGSEALCAVKPYLLCAGEPHLAELLLQRLLDLFAGPVLLWPLLAARPAGAADATARLSADPPLARSAPVAGAAADW